MVWLVLLNIYMRIVCVFYVRRDLLKYPMLGIELLIVWIKRFFKN